MEILHFEDLGDTNVVSECSLGVNLVIDNCLHVASGTCTCTCTSPSVYNLKAIGLLLMEILHFEDLGNTSVAVVLVLGEYQMSIAK